MRLSDLKYTEITGKHITVTAGIISIFCMAAGLFQQFFSNLFFILLCISGIGAAGYFLFLKHKEFNHSLIPAPQMPRPVIFNLIRDSSVINEQEILKLAGVDKMYQVPGIQKGYTDQRPDLMQAVLDLDCLMIWGGRGSGKTNFIQHLAQEKVLRGEDLWIIDPKPGKPGKWPQEVNVIGQGHNYQEITAIGEKYEFELDCRKAQFHAVEGFPKVTLIVDELYLLNMKIKGFTDMILPLLLEGREYNIHMILISQSKTAESMGFKGRYDLLKCFDAVIGLDRQGPKENPNSYFAVADFGKGDIDFRPPGEYRPFHQNMSQCRSQNSSFYDHKSPSDTQDRHDTPTLQYDPDNGEYVYQEQRFYDSKMEKAVVDLFINHPGISYNGICNHIWGASNGRRINQIKDILLKHNYLR